MTYYVVIDTNVLVSAALKHDSVPMAGKMIIHATKHVLALADIKHILRLVEYDIYPCEIIPPRDMFSSASPILAFRVLKNSCGVTSRVLSANICIFFLILEVLAAGIAVIRTSRPMSRQM